ncbi:MAG: hypothetical protein AAB594_00880 [Patescibacteria group bacterium]
MSHRVLLFVSVLGVIVIVGLVLGGRPSKTENPNPPIQNQNSPLFKTITSNEGGVEVAVTPINLATDSPRWFFNVSLNTHSVELSEDLVSVSRLVMDSGEVLNPTAWEGDPPGGHHRGGTLTFVAPTKSLSSVTLKILEVGGVPEREFKWDLK